MPRLLLEPIRVASGNDEEGMLVLLEDRLVGVLVRLSSEHGASAGHWFLEASFGPVLDMVSHPIFQDLDTAQDWFKSRP